MASVDKTVKRGSTQPWSFTISDTDDTALTLSDARVYFKMRQFEGDSTHIFGRDTGGVNSDYIAIATDQTTGVVTITPTVSDWSNVSDFGIWKGEFRVVRSDTSVWVTRDYLFSFEQEIA